MADKYSTEARGLRPYWIHDIDEAIRRRVPFVAAGGNGGGFSEGGTLLGAPSPHDLSSVHHSGTLSDSQAPQFALLDGSRPFTGSLTLPDLATVDGVDISAHVADPDAHHNQATAGTGIIVGTGQVVNINTNYDFDWTGQHSFTQDIQLSANLNFLGGARSITGSSDISLLPAGNLYMTPGTAVILDSAKTERSGDYLDGIPIAGYSLFNNPSGHRQLTTHTIKADELHVRVFVADTVRVDIGEEYWGKSMGIVYADWTTPSAVGSTVTVQFEDSVALTGALFASNDWLLIKTVDVGTGLEVNDIWGQVSGYVDLGSDANGVGRQQWTFTLRSGPINWPVKKGRLAVDFGVSGQGYVHLSTLSSAQGPWIQIGKWTGANPYTAGNRTVLAQMGVLDGVPDAALSPSGPGLYTSNGYFTGKALFGPAGEVILDSTGVRSQIDGTADNANTAYRFTRQDDGSLVGGLYAYRSGSIPGGSERLYLRKAPKNTAATIELQSIANASYSATVNLYSSISGGGGDNNSQITLTNTPAAASQVEIRARNIKLNPYSGSFGGVAGHVEATSDFLPTATDTYNLGQASLRWNVIYAKQIIADSTSGPALSGSEWEFAGSMIIDPNSASNTTLSVTNQGSGTASLSVEGDITSGGLVNGVNVGVLDSNYNNHAANAGAHHQPVSAAAGGGITVAASQVLSVDSSVVRTSRLVSAGAGLSGGGSLAADRTFDVELGSPSGLAFGAGGVLVVADSLAGNGLTMASKVISIVTGAGLELAGGAVRVDLSAVSGLEIITGGELQIADTLAGAGLAMNSSKQLDIGGGNGIAVGANTINVQLATPSGMVLSGAGLALNNLVAGAGLVFDGNLYLSVGAGNGIVVGVDAVAVNLAAYSGLEFGAGQLRMGTPTDITLADATSSVQPNTHIHHIVTSSDVSAGTAAILASTSAGGLSLKSLLLRGNLDIVDYGDLTVGANVFTVMNLPDEPDGSNLSRVGIMGPPDPQFALDVWGPIRGEYLVGPHALLVKDVLLLSHFDGKEPFNTNLIGEPNSILGQVATLPSNPSGVVYRPGKFGKAIEIAAATTNLISNPQFDSGSTTGWSDYVTGAATGSRVTLATRELYAGAYSYRLVKTGGANTDRWGTITTFAVTSGLSYSVSVWVNVTAISGGNLQIRLSTDNNVNAAGVTYTVPSTGSTDGWIRLTASTTATATGTANLRVFVLDAATCTLYISAAQAVQSAYSLPYTQTNRIAGNLSYANISPSWTQLTVMAWIFMAASGSSMGYFGRVCSIYKDASNLYELQVTTGDKLRLAISSGAVLDSTQTIPANTWTHVGFTIGPTGATLYVNGVATGPVTPASTPQGTLCSVYVGSDNGLANRLNALIDDFAIVNRTLPAKEMLSIYESNAPIFVETSHFTFRATPAGLVWADDEGLWMKDALGNAVAGFYGGEAASKSWGGTTLSTGDILFGRYGVGTGGWLRFDRDGDAGNPLLSLGYLDKTIFTLNSSIAKLQGVNLEIVNASAQAILGVFASAPPSSTWGGISGVAAGDVVIGDMARGNAFFWNDDLGNIQIGSSAAGNTALLLAGSDISFRRGTTYRLRLLGTGAMTINDSGGAAVFTFDASAGAEFTKPLTLGASGGIYQGTGTFANPAAGTGIGLKIFNSGGIGKLSTYNAGVEQITLDTDGKFKAGAGNVILDATGVTILTSASAAGLPNALTFSDGTTQYAEMRTYSPSAQNVVGLNTFAVSGRASQISLRNNSPTGQASTIAFDCQVAGSSIANMTFGGMGVNGVLNLVVVSASGATPVISMLQNDNTAEFFRFNATIGSASNRPIDTAALGTYYGKIRVNVGGVGVKWMPLYN